MIVLPSHASLEVGQRVALRAKSVTEATGPGDKDVWTCLAVCAHYCAGDREAGNCAVGDSTAGIEFEAKHPAILLPVVADLAACQEHRSIDAAAID
ncbi:hypothetical protein CP49_29745 [Bradyrhizobium valentinum]|uniref:Uncharacterized protein n=1 Tax=Bradyrhizobium valentinum TaxID=1518501 RepID=A0A0R3LT79_9BRAD|nr:hypothetical protein CP49_29745 [Bradyrhizobium valentinum]